MKQGSSFENTPLLARAAELLSAWYRENGTPMPWRDERSPYRTWISEIMLQQTRTAAVIPYFERFMKVFPDVQTLADADEETLMKLWEGLGYYSRARNLHKAAKDVVDRFGGELPRTAKELTTLAGIGEYTAGAIASICFGEPEPAVDGNVLRVVTRLLASRADIALPETKRDLTEALRAVYPKDGSAGLLTEALMELGEQVCIPNGEPKCLSCPLAEICLGLAAGKQNDLPVKSPKKARRVRPCTVLLLRCGQRYAIAKRPEKGLLAGLWEFPNADGHLSADEALAYAQSLGARPVNATLAGDAIHVFTHIEWHMRGYFLECEAMPAALTWATPAEITDTYTVPKAFRAYLNQIQITSKENTLKQ